MPKVRSVKKIIKMQASAGFSSSFKFPKLNILYIYTYHLVTTLGSKIIIKGTLKCKKHICICLAVIYLQLLVAAR